MLKSQVSVALCVLLSSSAVPAMAHPTFSGSRPSGASPAPASANVAAISHASYSVFFSMPGRQMKKFVVGYLRDNDEELTKVRERSQRPFTIIDSVMGVYDLPAELRYLAVIESDLQPAAVSRVGAKGPWQLMAPTARDLGLKVSRRWDERTNYYKSTHAAALYLRDLHTEFKDWLLVLAAYNSGPVPVERAIRLAHSRNFWVLQRYLPAETRQHVKRFIATANYFALNQAEAYPCPGAPVCKRDAGPVPNAGPGPNGYNEPAGFGLTAFPLEGHILGSQPVGLNGFMLGQSGLGHGSADVVTGARYSTVVVAGPTGEALRREDRPVAATMRNRVAI